MVGCPECGSEEIQSHSTTERERQDDEHETKITKAKCNHCGCEFEVIERWSIETEVTTHGKEYIEEDFESGQ